MSYLKTIFYCGYTRLYERQKMSYHPVDFGRMHPSKLTPPKVVDYPPFHPPLLHTRKGTLPTAYCFRLFHICMTSSWEQSLQNASIENQTVTSVAANHVAFIGNAHSRLNLPCIGVLLLSNIRAISFLKQGSHSIFF